MIDGVHVVCTKPPSRVYVILGPRKMGSERFTSLQLHSHEMTEPGLQSWLTSKPMLRTQNLGF